MVLNQITVYCEAVRSAILGTVWLLVVITHSSVSTPVTVWIETPQAKHSAQRMAASSEWIPYTDFSFSFSTRSRSRSTWSWRFCNLIMVFMLSVGAWRLRFRLVLGNSNDNPATGSDGEFCWTLAEDMVSSWDRTAVDCSVTTSCGTVLPPVENTIGNTVQRLQRAQQNSPSGSPSVSIPDTWNDCFTFWYSEARFLNNLFVWSPEWRNFAPSSVQNSFTLRQRFRICKQHQKIVIIITYIFTCDSICYSVYMPRLFRPSICRSNVSLKFFYHLIGPVFWYAL